MGKFTLHTTLRPPGATQWFVAWNPDAGGSYQASTPGTVALTDREVIEGPEGPGILYAIYADDQSKLVYQDKARVTLRDGANRNVASLGAASAGVAGLLFVGVLAGLGGLLWWRQRKGK